MGDTHVVIKMAGGGNASSAADLERQVVAALEKHRYALAMALRREFAVQARREM